LWGRPRTRATLLTAPPPGLLCRPDDEDCTTEHRFEQVIHDLDRQVEEHGGEDKEELRLMVAEIRRVLETQDSISKGKFERWSELANKHAPWLLGPLGSLLVNYAFGP
jgi:hypothetical protein